VRQRRCWKSGDADPSGVVKDYKPDYDDAYERFVIGRRDDEKI
jgi:hypothetical protein